MTVTLESDIITAVEVVGDPQKSESEEYQAEFIGGIADVVVGKDIDEISVSRVAGSSLTSGGFNQAIQAIKGNQPVAPGTHFVLVDYREGKVFRYFVMEKGSGWGADYREGRRTGDWQFQWFWPDRSVNLNENTARCQSCHSSQAAGEYLFTGNRIPRFDGKPVE